MIATESSYLAAMLPILQIFPTSDVEMFVASAPLFSLVLQQCDHTVVLQGVELKPGPNLDQSSRGGFRRTPDFD